MSAAAPVAEKMGWAAYFILLVKKCEAGFGYRVACVEERPALKERRSGSSKFGPQEEGDMR